MGYPESREELEAAGFRFDAMGRCRGARCRADIEWWYSPKGKRIPLNPDDKTGHHTTCPDVAQFNKPSGRRG